MLTCYRGICIRIYGLIPFRDLVFFVRPATLAELQDPLTLGRAYVQRHRLPAASAGGGTNFLHFLEIVALAAAEELDSEPGDSASNRESGGQLNLLISGRVGRDDGRGV